MATTGETGGWPTSVGMRLPEVVAAVKSLGLPEGDFALHGSAPLLAHGLVEEVNDIDIVSRRSAWRHATSLAEPVWGDVDLVVRPRPGLEIFNGWLGEDADELIDDASIIEGILWVTLEAVLRFKRRLNRPKDLSHIRLIEEFLATGR